MNVNQMRKEIILPYNNELWKSKVAVMPDEQVIAIYNRFVMDKVLPIKSKTVNKLYMDSSVGMHTLYVCNWCGATYVRDNPDLEECEECGQRWD